ncbi:hypothetical protein B4113_4104 [Geobacillus sp. B4113_201601]|nr:hypothetical protein B4113_4104 [Geobacillus sp. B4113_201601]
MFVALGPSFPQIKKRPYKAASLFPAYKVGEKPLSQSNQRHFHSKKKADAKFL